MFSLNDIIKTVHCPAKLVMMLLGFYLFSACQSTKDSSIMTEEKNYRPAFHFTPKAHWMNDPNGMFYFNGTYHLYYQYYPEDNVWGPMHWGHATSKDLVHWEEQPIALYPDEKGYIFSGSAVVDLHNSSGFGTTENPPIVAIFTHHNMDKERAKAIDVESQSIAYSLDEGHTWTKYEGNPVIANPGIRDFRDPKVLWDTDNDQWVMVLAAHDRVHLYGSTNLKEWTFLSEFGQEQGHHGGVWECPDLFPLTDDDGTTKWVMLLSINPGGPNGGSATQYFVGDFDGKNFTLDPEFEQELEKNNDFWVDFGRDNYAGVTWQNTHRANGNKLFIGWMSNWDYAQVVPTKQWRSAMTVAREIGLSKTDQGYRLTAKPAPELFEAYPLQPLQVNDSLSLGSYRTTIDTEGEQTSGFVFFNQQGDEIAFGYDPAQQHYFIDRSKAGNVLFDEKFVQGRSSAPRLSNQRMAEAIVVLDKTSIEIFWDQGKTVMTEIFFPNSPLVHIKKIED